MSRRLLLLLSGLGLSRGFVPHSFVQPVPQRRVSHVHMMAGSTNRRAVLGVVGIGFVLPVTVTADDRWVPDGDPKRASSYYKQVDKKSLNFCF